MNLQFVCTLDKYICIYIETSVFSRGPMDKYLSLLRIYIDHSYFIHLSLSKQILYTPGQAEFIAPAKKSKVVRVYCISTYLWFVPSLSSTLGICTGLSPGRM